MKLKDAYHQKAGAQLREWQGWIEQIRVSSSKSPAGKLSEDQLRSFERLEDCSRIASLRLDELRYSSDERWEHAKQAVEQAMIALKKALDLCGEAEVRLSVPLQPDRSHVFEPFYHRKG